MPGRSPYKNPAPSRGNILNFGTGGKPHPEAGRHAILPEMDPMLLQFLAINAHGVTTAELSMYLEKDRNSVGTRLRQLEASGRVCSFPDPMIPGGKLWGFPELTKIPATLRAPQQKKGRTR